MRNRRLAHPESALRLAMAEAADRANGDVLTGVCCAPLGGIRNHMLGIQANCNRRVSIVPDGTALELLAQHRALQGRLAEVFRNSYGTKRFAAVHSHVEPWFIEYCAEVAKAGTPWVHTYHLVYFESEWAGGLTAYKKAVNDVLLKVACKADVCLSVARWLRDLLQSEYGIESTYLPNGVDVSVCDKADPVRFQAAHGRGEFILFAAGIDERKNPADFVRLERAIPDNRFILQGRGVSREAVKQRVGLPIPSNMDFVGPLPREELLDMIAACRVFVKTSKSEGLPTVVMEAMALRRPVVGCNRFGTAEVIGGPHTGFVYQHDSLDDLVEKTLAAWDHPHVGEAARQRILNEYDWCKVAPRLDAIYDDLLARKVPVHASE